MRSLIWTNTKCIKALIIDMIAVIEMDEKINLGN